MNTISNADIDNDDYLIFLRAFVLTYFYAIAPCFFDLLIFFFHILRILLLVGKASITYNYRRWDAHSCLLQYLFRYLHLS